MPAPQLLYLPDEPAYRMHYIRHYVNGGGVRTFDGILVRFFPTAFKDAFYRDSAPKAGDKALFDWTRAERMDWIRWLLTDPQAKVHRRRIKGKGLRRIALDPTTRYAVITQVDGQNPQLARFITAYVATPRTVRRMCSNPAW